jgi:hypothetical protein
VQPKLAGKSQPKPKTKKPAPARQAARGKRPK